MTREETIKRIRTDATAYAYGYVGAVKKDMYDDYVYAAKAERNQTIDEAIEIVNRELEFYPELHHIIEALNQLKI